MTARHQMKRRSCTTHELWPADFTWKMSVMASLILHGLSKHPSGRAASARGEELWAPPGGTPPVPAPVAARAHLQQLSGTRKDGSVI